MRVYLASTLPLLARAQSSSRFAEAGATCHAVTPELREWYAAAHGEELEYVALLEAAEASLRLVAADPGAPRRRVVVAAEVPAGLVQPARSGEALRSTAVLAGPVERRHVVSVHIDDREAEADVDAAARALPAAARGDEDAQFVVDGADGHDLLWYDATEIDDLVGPPAQRPPPHQG